MKREAYIVAVALLVAMAAGSFGSVVSTPAELVAPKPEGLSFADAASIPSVFMTAHFALNHLARLGAGERVLIHSAMGGTGMAAVQLGLAQHALHLTAKYVAERRQFGKPIATFQVVGQRIADT